MTRSLGIGRGGARPGAGRKPSPRPVPATGPGLVVEEVAALGERPETIAAALRITVAYLQRDQRDALLYGQARCRCQAIGLLFAKARAGNLSAIRKILQLTASTAAEPVRLRQLGKQEAAQEAAKTAGAGSERGEDLIPAEWRSH